jgi:hypothetical protein
MRRGIGARHRKAALHKKVGRNASRGKGRGTGEQSGPSSVPRCTLAFRSFVAQRSSPDLFGGAKVLFGGSKEVPQGAQRRRPKKPPQNVSHFTFFSLGLAYRCVH